MNDSVPYRDLREWLEKVEALGELVRFRGAHWRLEMGGITEIIYRGPKQPKPAILFEAIPGYPPEQRALFGLLGSVRRLALTLGMPLDYDTPIAFVRACRDHLRALRPLPPVPVASSALLDDEHAGNDIDLLEFPVPLHHEDDGGRYLGTAHAVITRDPDTGWVNLGTYRVMFHDQRTLGLHMLPGRHGALHLQA
ncbi:MAG: UbiD family decarboxylase, partial [Deltaproteobacteria bacterium]|nr:UbiD family decarboxylase [Deltaproteobacteria bacterium]